MYRDELILKSAERLFYERGFDGVGVDAIGEEAGVSGSAIYRHFSGKDEILAALFDQAIDALIIDAGFPLENPDEELELLINVHFQFALQHPQLAGVWVREQRSLSDRYRQRYQRRQRQYLDRWATSLRNACRGLPEADLYPALRAVLTLLETATNYTHNSHPHIIALLRSMALSSLAAFEFDESDR